MEQRADNDFARRVEQATCKECGGRTDIPQDVDELKACTCEKTYAAGCEPIL
ncbi:hypothetical protein HQ489_04560 [Candidatus Woesearchaeota archaeon]|nr:hypothetical protein [Candidatus Woesearchaeota archaeon]